MRRDEQIPRFACIVCGGTGKRSPRATGCQETAPRRLGTFRGIAAEFDRISAGLRAGTLSVQEANAALRAAEGALRIADNQLRYGNKFDRVSTL